MDLKRHIGDCRHALPLSRDVVTSLTRTMFRPSPCRYRRALTSTLCTLSKLQAFPGQIICGTLLYLATDGHGHCMIAGV